MLRPFCTSLLLLSLAWVNSAIAASPSDRVDFARDIQPILKSACYDCHGSAKAKGGLRLDIRDKVFAGGNTGPAIVRGKSAESLLVRRLHPSDDEDQMPLKADPLTPEKIALFARWIDQGADWPDALAGNANAATHWSFVPPVRATPPAVKQEQWARNEIDRFILARLEAAGIAPSPEASRETLLRRVSLDLTGLPPSPAEIDAFVADRAPDAYEKVVDRLLASPAYGERWAKHWLDAARYADSNGYSIDSPRVMWTWRDWVIDAISRDMPFDQFTIQQLAGDMLPAPSGVEGAKAALAQRIATGFHRNTQINEEGGIDPEQFRIEAVIDRVGTTSTVFLGLTVACAQCHNHKFDPISQKEYYQLFAFLNNQDEPKVPVPQPGDEARAAPVKALEAEVAKLEAAQKTEKDAAAKATLAKDLAAKKKELTQARKKAEGVTAMVLTERATRRPSHLFIKGDFTRPGEPVDPGTLRVLHPLRPRDPAKGADRLDLANWIIDPANPLTGRVIMNRSWQQFFGKGLVETENDFGTQGTPPTHPELLDWLATEFPRRAWSMKAMHRLMVTSATYRQSSNLRRELTEVDPYNKLLARQNRVRLEAEIVRDVCLTASGLLVRKVGGPSVFPPQPAGVGSLGQRAQNWPTSKGEDRYRRGMYTFLFRATPHPLLGAFDAPDGTSTCTRRIRSNTPLQALTLLNDEAFVECSQSLAALILNEKLAGDDARINFAFRLCTGRSPGDDERAIVRKLLATQTARLAKASADARAIAGRSFPENVPPETAAAWTVVARTLLNLDETITRE